ncbi:MAG TPA: hypothetical protein VIH24_07705 [Candidatus Limnocylindria bacterium]
MISRPVLVCLLLVATACGNATTTPEPSQVPEPSRAASAEPSPSSAPSAAPPSAGADASADLDLLLELLEVIHPEPFHGIPRDEWVGQMHEIQAAMAGWTPEETMVAVMELVASLSREGQDGHQLAFPPNGGPMLPIRVFEFDDGLFITDAIDAALIGSRITAVAGRQVDDVLDLLEPLVPRDSPATVPGFRPFYLLRADVLQGLGVIEDDASVSVTLERDGESSEAALQTIASTEYTAFAGPLGIIHLPVSDGLRFTADGPLFWTEQLAGGALYVRLSQVQAVPNSAIEELSAAIESPDVTRVIFDLRHNPGGNNTTYPYLLAILRRIEQPFWVLTDRRTFSAASNLATELEQTTDASFAGEEMGGGLNFWDDVQFIELERLPIPLSVGISTIYHQKSFADDPRLTIEPDLAVPYRSVDYFAGVDATLEAVLTAP